MFSSYAADITIPISAVIFAVCFPIAIALIIVIYFLKKSKPKSPPVTDTVNIYRSILGNPATATTPSAPAPTPSTEDPALIAQLRQNLRTKFLYQEDKIDHAIQIERDRNPTASLTDLMQAAIARYERENQ